MKIVRGDGDTVKFINISVGDTFYYEKILYLRVDDYWRDARTRKPGAVCLETGVIREFADADQVTPAKAEVVVQEVGRVACGFNPR